MKFLKKNHTLAAMVAGITFISAPAQAEGPTNLMALTITQAPEKVSQFEKQDALAFIEERLMTVDSGCAAFDYYLDTRDSILENDYEPSAVREMASLYRKSQQPPIDIIAQIIAASEDPQMKRASDAVFAASFALTFAK